MGWFYRFKLHLIISNKGKVLSFCLTSGNVNDKRKLL
ncbi:MAG: transposase [Ruminococcus sp.]|nr:transposase [Ruminococcus sp.]